MSRFGLDIEWGLLNAIRDAFGIAKKGKKPTYDQALKYALKIAPDIYDENSALRKAHGESALLRLYGQKALAESKRLEREISPGQLISTDIETLTEQILAIPNNERLLAERRKLRKVQAELNQLELSLFEFSEHQALLRDYSIPRGTIKDEAYGMYKDYNAGENKFLRIRMLHPNRAEHILGSDLVYEVYDQKHERVRFAHVQYKMWDGETLYWSQAKNLQSQLDKMETNFCLDGFCESGRDDSSYRCPHCCAFLRPTDRLVNAKDKLISSGFHIPVCGVLHCVDDPFKENKILRRDGIKELSLSGQTFDELFQNNMVGSRWVKYEELSQLYEASGILNNKDNLVLHAQEWLDEE